MKPRSTPPSLHPRRRAAAATQTAISSSIQLIAVTECSSAECKKGEAMGSEVCADEVIMNGEVICGSWSFISKVSDEEAKNVAGPATPEENGEHNHPSSSSSSSPPPSPTTCLETPKETLFDSFAPGSDKLLLAPRHRKYREESRNHVVRCLNFKDFDNDEERLFEIVYGAIMDSISAELELAKAAAGEEASPPRSTLLTGVAETCPAPPTKSATTRKRCIIDNAICRKLDFSL
ncbi:unknown protein 1-like [Salvia miltiorrhiza]|uniref:unknown protein 1-like n=1 Tax=Salvia miltiorrhiza TaxID=226208 RepID=UPI0025ABA65C|nr:unknown protein 1-like [Salvia miltiorrhiza]